MRHGLKVRFLLVLTAVWLQDSIALGQGATVRGFITDASTSAVLEGANITLLNDGGIAYGAASNAEGFYQIGGIISGRYVLRISYIAYTAFTDSIEVQEEDLVTRSVALQPGVTLDEVVIEQAVGAGRLQAGQQQVRPTDLGRIPTPDPAGDLASYLQTLPGVVSLGDRGGQLYIRGGTPSQNLVLLDGTMIYQPFHIIGFFSAFPQDLISHVDVFAGGFGARYSGKLSSVIDVKMREGNNQKVEGAASIGPFLASMRVEGPLRKGSLSLIGSVRTSVIEATSPTLLGEGLPLKFSDIMFKLQQSGSPNRRCSLTGVHTYDRGRINSDAERTEVFRWTNSVLAGRCVGYSPNSPLFIETNSGFSLVRNEVGDVVRPERTANAWLFNTDIHMTYPSGNTTIQGGFLIQIEGGAYTLQEQYQGFRSDKDYQVGTGIYGEVTFDLSRHLEIRPGLVVSYPMSYSPSVEPRIRMAWHPWGTRAQTLTAAAGLYRQSIQGINDERDVGSVFTVWIPNPVDEARAQAIHTLLGWQQQIGSLSFATEAYYKRINNLPVPIWSVIAQFTTSLTLADGNVYGVDSRVEFKQRPWYAYLGYGYAWTKYTTAQEDFGVWLDQPIQSYHPPHDRRHQINLVLAYDLRRFRTSMRWQYGSGLPYTQAVGTDSFIRFTNLPDVRRIYGNPRFLFDRPYQARLPAYHRLDLSMEYAFDIGSNLLTVQAGAINAYDQRNLFYFDLFTFRRVDQFSLLPYVSLQVEIR